MSSNQVSNLVSLYQRSNSTLVHFEVVYAVHFKANQKSLSEYNNLYRYMLDLVAIDSIRSTLDIDYIKQSLVHTMNSRKLALYRFSVGSNHKSQVSVLKKYLCFTLLIIVTL